MVEMNTSRLIACLVFIFETHHVLASLTIEITKRAPVHIFRPQFVSNPATVTIDLIFNVQLKDSLDTADTLGVVCAPLDFEVDDEQTQTVFEYELICDRQHTTLVAVRLTRGASGDEELYLPEVIKVTMPQHFQNPQPPQYFPIYRWLGRSSTVTVWEGDTFLPQDDPDREQRARFLAREKIRYRPTEYIKDTIYLIEEVPSTEWMDREYYDHWFATYRPMLFEVQKRTTDAILASGLQTFQDAYKFYDYGYTEPSHSLTAHISDHDFALQRVQGANPNNLERVRGSLPNSMPVESSRISAFLEGYTIEGAIAAKKLFMADYSYLATVVDQTAGEYMPAPIALFYQRKDKELMPVAIHTDITRGSIFYPDDNYYHWVNAKLWFNMADSNVHEAGQHLMETHLFVEQIAIGVYSTLSVSHPIFKLLKPHFRYTVAQNRLALGALTIEGQLFDQFNIGRRRGFQIVEYFARKFSILGNGHFINDLKTRGVYSKDILYNYRARDDGMLYWNAIHEYVSRIVNHYYEEPQTMEQDFELQEFNRFMRDELKMDGFPQTLTAAVTVEILTGFIFRSSVIHAMVNMPQFDEFSFVMGYPTRIMGNVPTTSQSASSQAEIMRNFNVANITYIYTFGTLLTSQDFGTIGSYEKQYSFPPSPMFSPAQRFRQTVNHPIQGEINRRNTDGRKYIHLVKNRVPNAPSV